MRQCFESWPNLRVLSLDRHPLSLWALHLNELTPELKEKLPPTDDRLRADMRLFEHGYYHEVGLVLRREGRKKELFLFKGTACHDNV